MITIKYDLGLVINKSLISMFQTLSRDSDSLITEEQDDREIAGKKIRENWKIVVAALLLFVLGIGMLILFAQYAHNWILYVIWL